MPVPQSPISPEERAERDERRRRDWEMSRPPADAAPDSPANLLLDCEDRP